MLAVRQKQLPDIAYDSSNAKPTRELVADTLTHEICIDIEATVTVAAGAADGALIVEQPLGMVKRIKVFDGTDAVVDIDPKELRQVTERQSAKALSGLALAGGGVQAGTEVRQQLRILFADPLSVNPTETALIPIDPKNFGVELEWVGTTDADFKGSLVSAANDRTFTYGYRRVRIMQVHDPVAFGAGIRPLFLPRIRSKTMAAPASMTDYMLKLETSHRVRWALLRTMRAGVTTEGIINRIGFEDDRVNYRDSIYARTWHEREQGLYGGATDDASIAGAYYFANFAQHGKLSQVWDPSQGSNPRWKLDITSGGATDTIRSVYCELEQRPGVTAKLPDNFGG